jgi:hypothetical protein
MILIDRTEIFHENMESELILYYFYSITPNFPEH